MTTHELADAWGAPEHRITRWCRMELLPARRTPGGWRIEPHARPPWRDGRMILAWMRERGTYLALSEARLQNQTNVGGVEPATLLDSECHRLRGSVEPAPLDGAAELEDLDFVGAVPVVDSDALH